MIEIYVTIKSSFSTTSFHNPYTIELQIRQFVRCESFVIFRRVPIERLVVHRITSATFRPVWVLLSTPLERTEGCRLAPEYFM